jgi:hypothetical protein
MKVANTVVLGGLCAALLGLVPQMAAQSGPKINDRYPVKDGGEIPPPIVSQVSECAKAVHVSGYIPHAIVKVFAHVTEQIGMREPLFRGSRYSVNACAQAWRKDYRDPGGAWDNQRPVPGSDGCERIPIHSKQAGSVTRYLRLRPHRSGERSQSRYTR